MDKLYCRLVLLSTVMFVIAGCSFIATAPIFVSIIRSPVTVSAFETNGPIEEEFLDVVGRWR